MGHTSAITQRLRDDMEPGRYRCNVKIHRRRYRCIIVLVRPILYSVSSERHRQCALNEIAQVSKWHSNHWTTTPYKRYTVCSYILVAWYPVLRTVQSALHFTPGWQTCSFRYQLDFSGKHLAMLPLLRNDCSVTFFYRCLQPGPHLYS